MPGTTWDKGRILRNDKDSVPESMPSNSQTEIDRTTLFEVKVPQRSLSNLIVPDHTSTQIQALIAKIHNRDILYEEWGLKEIDPHGNRTAINLYGPPGTGKSFCAEAIAKELGEGFIKVNYAEIESKYVGETPKNIVAAFRKAKQSGSILFFDEADSILGKRLTNVTQSADHGVNVSRSVMLLELDTFEGVVIFATNLASNYDEAFVRRILGHVEMPLPDLESRRKLWKYLIPSRMPTTPEQLDDEAYQSLAKKSDGLSGGDILNTVVTAATYAVQRPAPKRSVTIQDLFSSMEIIRKAKDEIGTNDSRSHISAKHIPFDELPQEAKKFLPKNNTPTDDTSS